MQIFQYTHKTLWFGVNIRVPCTIVNHLKHFDLLFRNLVGGFQFLFFFISFHLIVCLLSMDSEPILINIIRVGPFASNEKTQFISLPQAVTKMNMYEQWF